MISDQIPFNRPFVAGAEISNIEKVVTSRSLSGDGEFTAKCQVWLEGHSQSPKSLLTHSCTAALELAALILDLKPGDEVIMPSNTFSSTANAFALRGAVPVFIDIRPDTQNMDETLIEAAITDKTKAIVPVHYAGVACEMNQIMAIAKKYSLYVVEDAAQGVMADYHGRRLGGIGHLGAYSFHETKNVISGEGGSIQINDPDMIAIAEMIREKGTDRSRFLRGEKDKYTWQVIGSSFLPSELIAGFLWSQLESIENITAQRLANWDNYHCLLEPLEQEGLIQRPFVPDNCTHNAHMYYVVLPDAVERENVISRLAEKQIQAVSHYVPLHSSPAGVKYCRSAGDMHHTNNCSQKLLRLPLWVGLSEVQQEKVTAELTAILS